jgi:uncharacterized protein YbjT (DUF2867 family)
LKVVVLGGTRFIGRAIVEELVGLNSSVFAHNVAVAPKRCNRRSD